MAKAKTINVNENANVNGHTERENDMQADKQVCTVDKFNLHTIKKVTRLKDGTLPKGYKIADTPENKVLRLYDTVPCDSFEFAKLVENEMAKLAYDYWTSTGAELIDTTKPLPESEGKGYYKTFADVSAFYNYLNLKANGGLISKAMKESAASDVAKYMLKQGIPSKAVSAIKEAVLNRTMSTVHDLYMVKPKAVDATISALKATGHSIIAGVWESGKTYTPNAKKDDLDALDEAF